MSRLYSQQGSAADAWVGYSTPDEWIQADLLTSHLVQAVEVRPRVAHAHWITLFKLALSLDGDNFDVLRIQNGDEQVFKGPTEMANIMTVSFNTTEARYIRVLPLAWVSVVAIKWEVFACLEGMTHH